MQKVIITGASGFIGRQAVPFLQQYGYEIYPLHLRLQDQSTWIEEVKQLGAHALLHFAWDTTPGTYWHTPANLDWLKSSLSLMEAFVQAGGQRMVMAGSCAEQMPTTTYGACKEALRLASEAFLRRHQVSHAWGRIFFPYGVHEKSQRLLPSLIQSLLAGKTFKCASQNHIRDFLFVEDVAKAFVELLHSPVIGTVDIGTGMGTAVGKVVQQVAEQMGAAHLIQLSSAPSTVENPVKLIAQADRLYQEVGFRPTYTLQEGLEKTIQWWKQQHLVGC